MNTIGYTPGRSPLHRLDPRSKQAFLLGVAVVSVWGETVFLACMSLLLYSCFRAAGLRIGRLFREIRYFLFFLLLLFGVRSLVIENGWSFSFSATAASAALTVCWRLLLIVLMGVLIVATTRIAQLRAALIWYLKPLPFVREKMAATMVGMLVRFLPLILFRAGEISDALRSRCFEQRKNPVIRLSRYAMVLIRRVFLDADAFALALQARCYNEQRTLPRLAFSRLDSQAAGVVLLVCLTVLLD